MIKPTPQTSKPYLDYHDMCHYIENKYNIQTRDYLGKFSQKDTKKMEEIEYLDYWHWLCDRTNLSNGKIIRLPIDLDDDAPEFVKEITKLYVTEFGEYAEDGDLRVLVEW